MKLPSYLAKSRHGIFYFRLIYFVDSRRLEKRWSLHTKDPVEAKNLSLKIRAAMSDNLKVRWNDLPAIKQSPNLTNVGLERLEEQISVADEKNSIELKIIHQSPSGSSLEMEIDQNDPKDIELANEYRKDFFEKEIKPYTHLDYERWLNRPNSITWLSKAWLQLLQPGRRLQSSN